MRSFAGVLMMVSLLAVACAPADGQNKPDSPARKARSEMRDALIKQFDTSNPQVDLGDLLAGGPPKDGIPALTAPKRTKVSDATYPKDDARVVEVVVNGDAVAYPIGIMNWHELANDTVGGVPVVVTYCPLCDSVSVLDRRLPAKNADGADTNTPDADRTILEFGVSGLLLNSNVVMYDRTTDGLWSQVLMRAITGPHAGQSLNHLPIHMTTFQEFKTRHPEGEVLTTDTGHQRAYDRNPYERYFKSDRLFFQFEFGDALPAKTLGMGIEADGKTWFVVAQHVKDAGEVTIDTPKGAVTLTADTTGLQTTTLPDDVQVIQTFYHSWSAFHPNATIIGAPASNDAKDERTTKNEGK